MRNKHILTHQNKTQKLQTTPVKTTSTTTCINTFSYFFFSTKKKPILNNSFFSLHTITLMVTKLLSNQRTCVLIPLINILASQDYNSICRCHRIMCPYFLKKAMETAHFSVANADKIFPQKAHTAKSAFHLPELAGFEDMVLQNLENIVL